MKIVSGGTFFNRVDGKPLNGVRSVTWTMDAKDHPAGCTTIVLDMATVDLDVIESLDTLLFREA